MMTIADKYLDAGGKWQPFPHNILFRRDLLSTSAFPTFADESGHNYVIVEGYAMYAMLGIRGSKLECISTYIP